SHLRLLRAVRPTDPQGPAEGPPLRRPLRPVQERGTVPALTEAGRRRRRYVLVGGIATSVVAVDQLTKWWAADRLARGPITIVGPVRLALAHNTGAAFGLGRGLVPVVVLA